MVRMLDKIGKDEQDILSATKKSVYAEGMRKNLVVTIQNFQVTKTWLLEAITILDEAQFKAAEADMKSNMDIGNRYMQDCMFRKTKDSRGGPGPL